MKKITLYCFSFFLATTLFFAEKGFGTNYTGTWTSVTTSNTTLGALANYTLDATNPGSTGGATANSYVPSGRAVVVTFPSGYTLSTVNGGTVNATAITSGFTTTATTITFNTPIDIAKGAAITIVLNNITNSGTSGCYQLSMTIDNATGTGTGNQNLFAASEFSQYALGTGLCYCSSNASSTSYSSISNVTFNTINNSSGGCIDYTDFTSISTIVVPGSSYNLTITKATTCNTGTWTGRFAAWIDWNRNGVFDASEQVLSDGAASNGPVTVSVTVPTGAAIGTTRMRCIFREGSTVPPVCGSYGTWGETEDYSITINALTACSGTPNAGTTSINPSNGCGDIVTLTSSGSSLNSGLTYQWQKSTNGGSTWSNIGSAMSLTPSSITDAPSVTSQYRLSVICSNSGITSNSNMVTYTLNTGSLTTRTWIGAGAGGSGTDFNTAANWNPAAVPSSCDSVRIILSTGATITLSANATVGALVYTVSAGVTGTLGTQSYLLTVNRTSTFDATLSTSDANVNLASGGGIRSRGNCVVHNTGAGTTYFYAATGSPGYLQCDANLTIGTGGRTAAGVEPNLIFDAPVSQSWISNNTGTYFLGEDVIFGQTNSPTITLGGGSLSVYSVYNGNVQINNSTIVKAMNCPVDRFTGTGTFTMDSGSKLELNFTNDMPTPYTYSLDANSTVEYLGASSVQSINGITYGHLIAGGSGAKTAVANSIIAGNFLIRSGATYQAANSATVRTHNLRGNFTNDGTFTTNASFPSTFIMDGTIDQYIQGTVSSTFYNLTVNKASGIEFLNINTQVGTASAGVMAFTAGPLNLNTRTLTINNPATAAVTRSTGYAISENTTNASKIQWNMGTTTGSHIYPFGTTGGTYIPFTLNLTAGTIGDVTVSTYPTAVNNTPYPTSPQTVTHVNDALGVDNSANTADRFWQIDKTGGSGTATLTFMATAAEVGSIATLLAQRWNSSTAGWDPPATGQTSLATGATVAGVTTFSPWTLSGNASPLPIELVSFNAYYSGKNVDLKWTTSSETNNDYFTIERTTNATDFELVAKVKGAGSSNIILNYESVDARPSPGLTYYRLKQTDFDGKSEYSELVAVTIKNNNETFAVYPNPAAANAEISFNATNTEDAVLSIMDATGRLVLSQKISPQKGMNSVKLDTGYFTKGIYFVTLANKHEVLKTKFIKE